MDIKEVRKIIVNLFKKNNILDDMLFTFLFYKAYNDQHVLYYVEFGSTDESKKSLLML